MANSVGFADPVQTASIAIPLIALIVGLAINSLQEEDPWWYQTIVATLGICAFAPTATFFFISLAGAGSTASVAIQRNLVISSILVFALTFAVLMREVSRGLSDKEVLYLLLVVAGGLGIVWVIM